MCMCYVHACGMIVHGHALCVGANLTEKLLNITTKQESPRTDEGVWMGPLPYDWVNA